MSSIDDKPSEHQAHLKRAGAKESPRRPRDAEASRRALLEAASALFDERGYGDATVREIGERAGVDPALIARYFGGKEGLYLAALAGEADRRKALPEDMDAQGFAAALLSHWDVRGHSPLARAMGSPALSDCVRDQVCAIADRMLVEPLAGLLEGEAEDAGLRAELLVAVVLGVSLARTNGTLPGLAGASHEAVMERLRPVVDALVRG